MFLDFQKQFDTLFSDPEFGFHADHKLISAVISSLQFEFANDSRDHSSNSFVELMTVSQKMFFILQGQVDVRYMKSKVSLVNYREGGYF
eukprot:CAMPEP_0170504560 /NCGR_PEP_ID=MMETSP0208-20121228/48278_1 /TAXON_ID=197538 /ORGANISM="Strombidium inclinatum, Strain S3" /LENGTH=88 /DNA_ID=CAMNT_0010784885 /DNA_START=8 /DNA_END=271 /DNA_ORIENTATION=+